MNFIRDHSGIVATVDYLFGLGLNQETHFNDDVAPIGFCSNGCRPETMQMYSIMHVKHGQTLGKPMK
ncbi:hypothetical protein BLOT_013995 [Blomia tropicalis]|nr:hypothetical protein BLOT_013995 [Blomia tropicalis]